MQLSQKPGTSRARQSKQLTRDTATHCVSNQETGGKKQTTNNKLSNKKWSETAWGEKRSGNHNGCRRKSNLQVWSWSGSTSLPPIPARPRVYPKGGAPTTQTSPPSDGGGGGAGSRRRPRRNPGRRGGVQRAATAPPRQIAFPEVNAASRYKPTGSAECLISLAQASPSLSSR